MSPSPRRKTFIVGLGGPSGTGKSSVAKRVAMRLGGDVLSMEGYAPEMNHLALAERAKLNYDEPESVDVALLERHIRQYTAGNPIDVPIYNFAEHRRDAGRRERLMATPLLIVEGILALHFAELRPYFDLAIYLEAPQDVCFRRRRVRDITERQRSSEQIQWQYENHVLPAQRRYVVPSKIHAQLVIKTTADAAIVESIVYDAIAQKRAASVG